MRKVEIPLPFNLKISSFIFWSKIQTDRQENYFSVLWTIGVYPDTEHISGNKKMLLLKEKMPNSELLIGLLKSAGEAFRTLIKFSERQITFFHKMIEPF